jgi:hypothetical protein
MSLTAAAIRLMVEKGMTAEDIADIAEAMESPVPTLSKAALRTRRWREKKTENITGDVTVTHDGDVTHVREGAQVVNTTSSLRSEGTQEANASFVDAPSSNTTPAPPEKPKTKPPKAERGTRLPEDWQPSDADVEAARQEGLTDEEISRAALEFRNYWCSRSRDATRLSWPRTWHNRVIEIGDRKRRNGSRMAASSAQPGAGGRGPVSFADLYARRHGTG